MPGVNDGAQPLLKHQLKPALVLDASGTVIAINPAGVRLVCTSRASADHIPSQIKGTKISNLGITITPNSSLALWTWNDILVAAANVTKPNDDERTKTFTSDSDVFQATEEFWDMEASEQSMIESDVYFVKTSPASAAETARGANGFFKVKARANVCWYPPGMFLVVFDRPSMSSSVGRRISSAARYPQYLDDTSPAPVDRAPGAHPPTQSGNKSASKDSTPSASQVTSLIPYMMATINEKGQVVQFSDSWYHFTGLNKEESLGSGWVTAIHPADIEDAVKGWTEVLKNNRQEWNHEARYLKASTGSYYWFLIRAQAHKNASGDIVCWYASMMDVHDGVKARREADRRRNSMLTLISQTDVLLWGVDESERLYIREGGLDWEPPEISDFSQPIESQKTTRTGQGMETSNAHEQKELVSAVQAILLGREFTSIVEHTEGERHFRTIFVAEHTTAKAANDESTIEAALALTFETTDQIVQSTLRIENERLALEKRTASEASTMKSRFLANVGRLLQSFDHD